MIKGVSCFFSEFDLNELLSVAMDIKIISIRTDSPIMDSSNPIKASKGRAEKRVKKVISNRISAVKNNVK